MLAKPRPEEGAPVPGAKRREEWVLRVAALRGMAPFLGGAAGQGLRGARHKRHLPD